MDLTCKSIPSAKDLIFNIRGSSISIMLSALIATSILYVSVLQGAQVYPGGVQSVLDDWGKQQAEQDVRMQPEYYEYYQNRITPEMNQYCMLNGLSC
jgi:hypothetical protein